MIRSTALAAALALVPLAGCRGVHVPTASETGARKIADAAAKARALAGKIACSPDAVGKTLTGEGGESREIAQTLLAPAQAAAELRTLANEVGAAGGTEPQRREAKTLAARMRRDALLLDLMDLERVAQLKSMVVADIEARIAAVRSIEASGELTAAAELDAQVRSFRAAQDAYGALVAVERRRVDDAQSALQPLEAEIAEKRSGADRLDSEVQELRGAAAVADVARALPIIDEARQKLYKAQDMRLDANLAEQGAEPHRSAVRIGSAAFSGSDDAATALAARVSGAEQAAQGARTRSAAAKARTESLMSELGQLAQELQRLQSELFEPAVKSVEDALQAGRQGSDRGRQQG